MTVGADLDHLEHIDEAKRLWFQFQRHGAHT